MDYNIVSLRSILKEYQEPDVEKKLSTFLCSKDKDRERYLHNLAIPMEKRGMSRTYLAIDNSNRIVAYFSVGMECMTIPDNVPIFNSLRKKLNVNQETGVSQMYLLGQLARSDDSEPGLGSSLLEDAIDTINWAYLAVGCRVVRVDCTDDLVNYYIKHGFTYINKNVIENLNRMIAVID